MPSAWAVIDALMREIGAVRADARALDARVIGSAVALEIDRAISDAASALDSTIATPDDEQALTVVCEAIVVARERIDRLHRQQERADAAVTRSIGLRKRSAELLLRSIREGLARGR